MPAVKAVKLTYRPSSEILGLFKTFRQMCNDAIRIAIAQDASSRFDLISKSYNHLKQYGLHTHYILNACEAAYAVYKKWREDAPEKVRQILTLPCFRRRGVLEELVRRRIPLPFVKKSFLKLDNQTFRLDYLLLRIPVQARKFVFITLNGSLYHRSFLADRSLKKGSITITDSSVVIAFRRKTDDLEPLGEIGVDVNERNVTWSDTKGRTEQEDISDVAEIKERYKAIRAGIAQRTQRDRRMQRCLLSKYGKRESDRTAQRIHHVTKKVVEHAKTNKLEIVMEKLKGIRKLYRKGNGQGTNYRGRLNSWSFGEIQRQIAYKAAWEGIPVRYVNARGTSRNCLCGSRMEELEGRKMLCPSCGREWDRDVIASKNIMAAPLVRAARPSVCSDEGGTRR